MLSNVAAAATSRPALFKLAAALEDTAPNNLFASPARPLISKDEFKTIKTKEQAEEEEGAKAGEDITYQTAEGMKNVLYGPRMFITDPDWKKAAFIRRPVGGAFPYGLIAPRDKARGLVIAVQAQLIHEMLIKGDDGTHSASDPAKVAGRLKILYDWKQRRFFIEALASILWRAGEGRRASVVLLYPAYAALLYSQESRLEHLIKTLKVIDCVTYKQLCKVLDKRLPMFEQQDGGGLLMFLYSLILSRGIQKLEYDLQGEYLLTNTDQCSMSLITLALIGRATPYLFNGVQEYDLASKPLEVVRHGIKARSGIGILVVDRPDDKESRNAQKILIGSMLKTPLVPIWVLRLKGRFSLFFCCNLNLNRDWRSEARFILNFYTGQREQTEETRITVDSRSRAQEEKGERSKKDDKTIPLLDECIQSRWPGSLVDWNGTAPFF